MFIHIGKFAGVIILGLGWILPFVLWLIKKDESEYINLNGEIVFNWILSTVIYSAVSGILVLALGLGFLMLLALGICSLVFTIIGAIRASEGQAWNYPLSIPFFPTK